MPNESSVFGVAGLGRMGGGLALQALQQGARVVGFDPGGARAELRQAGLVAVGDAAELRHALPAPRVVFLYVPAGPIVDEMLDRLAEHLEPGDVLVDGGNSYWGDSIVRAERLRARGLRFVDLGTSGGVDGARTGACFMAGGDGDAVALVRAIVEPLAVQGGFVHAGPNGAGHFTKLVHNGIEFGMLQAIGEGLALLRAWKEAPLDAAPIVECWRHGSVIRSWLIDLLAAALRQDPQMTRSDGFVEDTGEVNWLVDDALRLEVPVPVIAGSVMALFASRDKERIAARAVVEMRHGFGGHPFGPNDAVARERRAGRVGWSEEPVEAPRSLAAE
jgi:6-phosphogluconate dehydrogenase